MIKPLLLAAATTLAMPATLSAQPVSAPAPAVTPAPTLTLADAIAQAYANNPDIAAQRALVRQVDEQAPQALSAGRPSLGANGAVQQQLSEGFGDLGRLLTLGATVNQPVYRGGQTRAGVRAADQRILAARARLRAVENTVIVNVVTAYADVQRTRQAVEITRVNVQVLETQLRQSRDRFQVGDVTRTDVAQSEARLAFAQSQLVAAQAQQTAAEASFVRLVGLTPATLAPLPPLPPLPSTLDQTLTEARANNPGLIAARFDEDAARYDVRSIRGQRLPTVGVSAGVQYQSFVGSGGIPGVFPGSIFTPVIGLTTSLPIFTGGLNGSRIRQAQARQSQLLEVIGSTDRQVTEAATNALQILEAARAQNQANRVAISASELALEGVRQENLVGARTVIEVLNAEQELLNARLNLTQSLRDEYVAGFQLLASVGRAEAVALGAPVEPYDAAANARRVRGRLSDFGGDPDPRTTPQVNHTRVVGPR